MGIVRFSSRAQLVCPVTADRDQLDSAIGALQTEGSTAMHEGLWEGAVEYYQKSVPLGRLAEPDDIAYVVLFRCSEAAKYVVGQTIHVNGGQYMAG